MDHVRVFPPSRFCLVVSRRITYKSRFLRSIDAMATPVMTRRTAISTAVRIRVLILCFLMSLGKILLSCMPPPQSSMNWSYMNMDLLEHFHIVSRFPSSHYTMGEFSW